MKTQRTSIIVLLAMLALLAASMACSAASNLPFLATPTPTNTSTPIPTSTPTLTSTPLFTPTATPLPDFSAVILKLEDLPAGFQSVPSQPANPDTQTLFSFVNIQEFQILSGASMLIVDPTDALGFDAMLNDPNLMMQGIASGANSSAFRDMQILPGMDNFGEASKGFTAVTELNNIMMQADFFIMKKGGVGLIATSFYKIGTTPPVSMQEIAKILAGRFDGISK